RVLVEQAEADAAREQAHERAVDDGFLQFAVPDGVADLMKEAGRNESEQEPCVPLAARRLRVPLVRWSGTVARNSD
ncbi:MAG: hypothetical protein ACO1SX_22010, partial [Actinomycetota bacterium]